MRTILPLKTKMSTRQLVLQMLVSLVGCKHFYLHCSSRGRMERLLSTNVGTVLEVTRFYVRWDDYDRAKDIVDELFGEHDATEI